MNTTEIVDRLDKEIARLRAARAVLASVDTDLLKRVKKGSGRPANTSKKVVAVKAPAKKRTMSPEGKARIAAAQKARWAKAKKAK
ncbi:hypothetical protein [Granulicella arctica]|uniref:Uncharacterized protein n=1 Tax=Granulicella arctica TaxID=940613 RepID=A0A7Y9PJL9_9BACT|nr:hypothetical protein [Granulicella arctica]NYF81112.1 hypothetical protein [Granulicella arctica]